ncbi:uncharacterized protein LOC129951804 isoform X1 [Eupeodes corollae]|uniref:uncharacterized protein LOC129951804 isoform X1 n=1 Tax=Eupeodes corollae TaxID=290404 RepID=UPI0024927A5B|nr:uncharacterized protein LOC129951804 isoform X1 [Eupeodes corollae]
MNFSLVVSVFAFLLSLATAESDLTSNKTTIVEFHNRNQLKKLNITFEAFTPRGLRVIVPSIQGIDLFSFQAKINLPIFKREDGTLVWEVINPLEDNLVKEFPNEQLLIGDIINFWIRIQSNGVSLQSESFSHIIKELVSNTSTQHSSSYSGGSSFSQWQTTRAPIVSAFQSRTTTVLPIIHARPIVSNYADIPAPTIASDKQCECNEEALKDVWTKMNATVAKMRALEDIITPLEEKLNSLTETVVELIKNMDIGTRLLLTGNLPSRTNPVEDVRHLIVEKLKLFDLSTTILQAEYKNNGILFDVSSSIDKLRILKRSNDILSKLSYQIIDPDRPVFDVRMARK